MLESVDGPPSAADTQDHLSRLDTHLRGWKEPPRSLLAPRPVRERTGEGPVLLVPLLVVVLGDPERRRRSDLGGDRLGEALLLLRTGGERLRQLLVTEGEDRGSVLAALVGPLAFA